MVSTKYCSIWVSYSMKKNVIHWFLVLSRVIFSLKFTVIVMPVLLNSKMDLITKTCMLTLLDLKSNKSGSLTFYDH